MPGITGVICRNPCKEIERDLDLMIEAMRHEESYVSGQYVNKEIGLYVGWIGHEGTVATSMPLISRNGDIILIFQGENHVSDNTAGRLHHPSNGAADSDAQYLLTICE